MGVRQIAAPYWVVRGGQFEYHPSFAPLGVGNNPRWLAKQSFAKQRPHNDLLDDCWVRRLVIDAIIHPSVPSGVLRF
jgi:hypothetical protein